MFVKLLLPLPVYLFWMKNAVAKNNWIELQFRLLLIVMALDTTRNIQQKFSGKYSWSPYSQRWQGNNGTIQIRSLEDDVHAQIKSNRECNTKRHEHGRNVRLKCNESQVENMLAQDEIVGNKINSESQNRICSATRRIMIGLQGHKAFEYRIENIQRRSIFVFYCGPAAWKLRN